jgi:heme/copper-type cytochrome/quinol oxidase subunit 1
MNASDVGFLLMVVGFTLIWGGVSVAKRWQRTRRVGYLSVSFWVDQHHSWDHWFAVGGVVYLVAVLPWLAWSYRREVRKHGRPRETLPTRP